VAHEWPNRSGQADREIGDIWHAIDDLREFLMSGLTDLQANVAAQTTALAALQAEWSTFLADLTTALGNADSDAAVEAAAQLVAQQTENVNALTAALQTEDAVVNPPAPAPAEPAAS
jgi:hypothetical protein